MQEICKYIDCISQICKKYTLRFIAKNKNIFVHISCIFDTAYFVHIFAYFNNFNLHVMAYLPLCIFSIFQHIYSYYAFQGQSV